MLPKNLRARRTSDENEKTVHINGGVDSYSQSYNL